ncbi:hypothetical protein TNCT_422011 [Trichonephila clavata]|uniref:Uncharacterized protein n=1 Tax=Trichonephila clavata TaxID=2740835 RepID=A0A8X6J479_TRICU|nr:hypothetical protein TNCT_422011 [Trichonephila clavata]
MDEVKSQHKFISKPISVRLRKQESCHALFLHLRSTSSRRTPAWPFQREVNVVTPAGAFCQSVVTHPNSFGEDAGPKT